MNDCRASSTSSFAFLSEPVPLTLLAPLARTCCGRRVRDFEVEDKSSYGVQLSWDKDGAPLDQVIFPRNSSTPSSKVITFNRCLSLSPPVTLSVTVLEQPDFYLFAAVSNRSME